MTMCVHIVYDINMMIEEEELGDTDLREFIQANLKATVKDWVSDGDYDLNNNLVIVVQPNEVIDVPYPVVIAEIAAAVAHRAQEELYELHMEAKGEKS